MCCGTDGQIDRQTASQTDRPTDRHPERWTDRRTSRQKDGLTDRQTDGHGYIDSDADGDQECIYWSLLVCYSFFCLLIFHKTIISFFPMHNQCDLPLRTPLIAGLEPQPKILCCVTSRYEIFGALFRLLTASLGRGIKCALMTGPKSRISVKCDGSRGICRWDNKLNKQLCMPWSGWIMGEINHRGTLIRLELILIN